MPSFDIVCKIDMQEVDNAVNQARKEIATRYDFKGSKAEIVLDKDKGIIALSAEDDYKIQAITEILRGRMVRRKLDPKCLDYGVIEDGAGGLRRQKLTIKQGVSPDLAKRIMKTIKEKKMKKIQASYQGDFIRVSGKKRDDLQAIMALVRGMEVDRPLSFTNLRD